MAVELSDRVREIAQARGLPEPEVFEQALERGLEDLWDDLVLAQYLDGELDREEAIKHVGRPKVERAKREREVVEENVDRGLDAWRWRPYRTRDRSFTSPKSIRSNSFLTTKD